MSEIFGNGVMGGGGLTNSKLALADASPEDVRSGKKFYSGDKQLKTGTLAEVEGGVPGIVITDTGAIIATVDQPAGIVSESQHGAIKQMTTKQGETAVAADFEQTIVDEKVYTLGAVKIAPVAGIIRVTYPAGSECTCAYTNGSWTESDPTGVSVFILPAVGTYTVSITDGTQTAAQTVEITETNRYANITLAYFSATISITYPANSTCTVTNADGATVVSDTNSGTEAKTWAATVGSTGTYTITATATDGSGKTKTTTVSITTDGQSESVKLSYALILYDNGVQNVPFTTLYDVDDTGSEAVKLVRFDSDHIYITAGDRFYSSGVITDSAQDLSEYNTLEFDIDGISADIKAAENIRIAVKSQKSQNRLANKRYPDELANAVFSGSDIVAGTLSLDISALTEGFPCITCQGKYTGTNKYLYFNVTEIRLV